MPGAGAAAHQHRGNFAREPRLTARNFQVLVTGAKFQTSMHISLASSSRLVARLRSSEAEVVYASKKRWRSPLTRGSSAVSPRRVTKFTHFALQHSSPEFAALFTSNIGNVSCTMHMVRPGCRHRAYARSIISIFFCCFSVKFEAHPCSAAAGSIREMFRIFVGLLLTQVLLTSDLCKHALALP